ncbi:hypothetical protein [Nocardia brasiliensis]|uniref:hypothetical protein n=1 Tax=Nocardia brasiliensis TaxID=37326 RepID=UPI002455B02F|nr:hypothetical protein [Nocardia brasiliensis]
MDMEASIKWTLDWIKEHGYNPFVDDAMELIHMVRLGTASEAELHTRARELTIECELRCVVYELADEADALIENAFDDSEQPP